MSDFSLFIPLVLVLVAFYLVHQYDKRHHILDRLRKDLDWSEKELKRGVGTLERPFVDAYGAIHGPSPAAPSGKGQELVAPAVYMDPRVNVASRLEAPSGYESAPVSNRSYQSGGNNYVNNYETQHAGRHVVSTRRGDISVRRTATTSGPYLIGNDRDNVYGNL